MSSAEITSISGLTGPNEELAEAQARICTGPHQSRPLGLRPTDPDPARILDIIFRSLDGSMPADRRASTAQIGTFLSAMTLRRDFPPKTAWSPAETAAFQERTSDLESLPPYLAFLFDPGARPEPKNETDRTLIEALRTILSGGHLGYEHARRAAQAVLDLKGDPALKGSVLIGQRMNRETYDEFKGYVDAAFAPGHVRSLELDTLTHVGEPYNGSTRTFKPTLFVAAVRAAMGYPTVLHGVDRMPPKWGITEEQIVTALGASADLELEAAADLLIDPEVGFVYVSQRIFSPAAYAARAIREHIKKRPPWAATEKAQQLFRASGRNAMAIGYFHPGYEKPQLRLMAERGFNAGVVIKGEEATSQLSLRLGKPSDPRRKAVNYAQGFGSDGDFALDIDPADHGFHYAQSPRPEDVSPHAFARSGMDALTGARSHVYDRIVLNAGMLTWLVGEHGDASAAIEDAREAVDSGRARARLEAFVARSHARRATPSAHVAPKGV